MVFAFLCCSSFLLAQNKSISIDATIHLEDWQNTQSLTQDGALKVMLHANILAEASNKKIAIAILDASGSIILMTIADGVGPHNLEAARRKAFTALSTKTPTLQKNIQI